MRWTTPEEREQLRYIEKFDGMCRRRETLVPRLEEKWGIPHDALVPALMSHKYPVVPRWPPDIRQLDMLMWAAAWQELLIYVAEDRPIPDLHHMHHKFVENPEQYENIDLFVAANLIAPAFVASGAAPVLQLTEAQQQALWFSDPPEILPHEAAFDTGVMVVLATPIPFLIRSVGELVAQYDETLGRIEPGTPLSSIAAVFFWGSNVDQITVFTISTFGRVLAHSGAPLDLFVDARRAEISDIVGDGVDTITEQVDNMLRCVKAAAYDFGMQDTPPPVLRPDRPERRRRDRVEAKRKYPSRVVIRYLRDSGTIRVGEHRETGRHVRPHLRRGHFRNVRTGMMSQPKEDRPTVRRYVPPVIVNGHLGTPREIVAYRDMRKSSSSSPDSQASINASA